MKYLNNFLLMFQFLTRIPINLSLECEERNFKRGAFYLPIVGLFVGFIQWVIYYFLIKVLPAGIVAVFIVLSSVLITGALHVDGLGDTCDGFYAFKGKERIIEIMKDSRIGTFAGIAIVMDLILKIISMEYISENNLALIIIAVPIVARFSISFLSLIGKPAKSTGSGNLFIGNMSRTLVTCSGIMSFAICALIIGLVNSVYIFITAILITILVNQYSKSKINGLTGDILGANNELVEIFVLIVYIAVQKIL